MQVKEIDASGYTGLFRPALVYDASQFNELNQNKVEKVRYFILEDSKLRFGVCMGEKDGTLSCPFSAPFGTLAAIKQPTDLMHLDEALAALEDFFRASGITVTRFTLPPLFYQPDYLNYLVTGLLRNGYETKHIDLNYQLDLKKAYSCSYIELLPRNGRKNLKIAMASGLTLLYCDTDSMKKEAYGIIKKNREAKGYPLRMTYRQVKDTCQIIEHDFFIVAREDAYIAAAQVFHITETIAQVIYWGDIPGSYTAYKPMNFLSYQLIQYYGERGYAYLDIGPSTEHGIPNYGLCSFKTSIGCETSLKYTFEKRRGEGPCGI